MVSSNLTDSAIRILKGRYLVKDENTGEVTETPSDMFRRVAKAIASRENSSANKSKYEENSREFKNYIIERSKIFFEKLDSLVKK